MTKAQKALFAQCHPDRNGGDHSLMERVYETLKHPSQAMDVIRRCRICGVRIGGVFTCRMHRYTRTAIAALWLIILPVFGADKAMLGWTPADTVTTNFIIYQSTNEITWTRAGFVLGTNASWVTNKIYPSYYRVTAVTWDGDESVMSAQLAIVARDTVTTVYGQHGRTPTGPWTDYQAWIFRGTNVNGMKFFRTRATQGLQWRTITTP